MEAGGDAADRRLGERFAERLDERAFSTPRSGSTLLMTRLPAPRGEISAWLIDALARPVEALPCPPLPSFEDPLGDDDFQLALYVCYELHYRGFADVDERWEWEPSLLAFRARLEDRFDAALHHGVPFPRDAIPAGEIDVALRAISEQDSPPLSNYVRSSASYEQVLEFMVHRSGYQLKEADPHSWAIPRLAGPPKASSRAAGSRGVRAGGRSLAWADRGCGRHARRGARSRPAGPARASA